MKTLPLYLGAYVSGTYTTTVDMPGRVALSKLRVHDGCLTDSDVYYNYVSEGLQYQGTPSQTAR